MSNKYSQTNTKLIEAAANGEATISVLKDKVSGIIGVPVRAGSKEDRLAAVSGLWEAGNVFVPSDIWADDFVEELVTFPNGAHDDQVDAMTMALNHLTKKTQHTNIVIPTSGTRVSPWGFADARP